jgi:predicted PurR-regulated permease PerM
MKELIAFGKREDVQKFFALGIIVLLLVILKDLISILLLTAILSYLAINAAYKVRRWTKLPYGAAVLVVYVAVLFVLAFAFRFIVPTLVQQFSVIPGEVGQLMKEYPFVKDYFDEIYAQLDLMKEVTSNWKSLLTNGIDTISSVGKFMERSVLAVFLSFVLSLTWQHLKAFGKQFLHSDYPKLFGNIYELGATFIRILGSVIEVQLLISLINTILMMIGLSILGIPSVLVMGLMIFILGLIPIAGVIISLIPLSVMAFATHGYIGIIEVIVLIIIIHMFESYFLHPRLMASRTELPVFLTFLTLIVMEHLLGAWGLIVGVPIVAFILNLIGVQHAPAVDDIE